MILSRNQLLKAIRQGKIRVTPFSKELVGPCSIDFRLGSEFKRIKKKKELHLKGNLVFVDDFHESITITQDKPLKLKPKELVLGVTFERFGLSDDLCGWIHGRSKVARLGLFVHVSSSFIQPGSDNHQVLEILNMSPQPIYLYPGAVVGQIVFEEVKGKARYSGTFQHQTKP